jgi:hypothetical protein
VQHPRGAAAGHKHDLITHQGETVGYVIEGQLELTIDTTAYVLSAGDSFFFKNHLANSYRNIGSAAARVLWVNTPQVHWTGARRPRSPKGAPPRERRPASNPPLLPTPIPKPVKLADFCVPSAPWPSRRSRSRTPTPATSRASRCRGARGRRRAEVAVLQRAARPELGLDVAALSGDAGAALFAGNTLPDGAEPIAQAYAGHQFGGFSPQLGDGRAVLLGEVIDRARTASRHRVQGLRAHAVLARRRRQGGGRADAARGADRRGDARARHPDDARARGRRDRPAGDARDGAAGAVLTRVAASHIRVGTFQFFAARGDVERVRQLAEYTIARHDPELVGTPGASSACSSTSPSARPR